MAHFPYHYHGSFHISPGKRKSVAALDGAAEKCYGAGRTCDLLFTLSLHREEYTARLYERQTVFAQDRERRYRPCSRYIILLPVSLVPSGILCARMNELDTLKTEFFRNILQKTEPLVE